MASKRHWRKKQERARAAARDTDAGKAFAPPEQPASEPVNLQTILSAPTPERRIGAPRVGDDYDDMNAPEVRLAALSFLQTRQAIPLFPFAPVLTPDIFDKLLALKSQTGQSQTFTIYPVMQAYIDKTAGDCYNRPVLPTKADDYTRAMLLGKWRPDGNPTQFNWDAKRHNGQHRGLACRRSGKPYAVAMSFGHDPEDYKTMDQGAVRRARDLFDQNGWPYPNLVASTVTWITRYLDNHFDSRSTPVPEDLLKRAVDLGKDSIIDAVKVGRSISININAGIPAQYLAMVYWLARKVSPDQADHFFEAWAIGGTSEYPLQAAVYKYIRKRHEESMKAVLDTVQVGVLINAWNYFATVGGGRPGMGHASVAFHNKFSYAPKKEGDDDHKTPVVSRFIRTTKLRPTTQFRKRRGG